MQYLVGMYSNEVRKSLEKICNYSLYNSSSNIEKSLLFPIGKTPSKLKGYTIEYGETHFPLTTYLIEYSRLLKNKNVIKNFIIFEIERVLYLRRLKIQSSKTPRYIEELPSLKMQIENEFQFEKNKLWMPYVQPFSIYRLV